VIRAILLGAGMLALSGGWWLAGGWLAFVVVVSVLAAWTDRR
jgi:hypothetical protein